MSYKHLSITEREMLLIYRTQGLSLGLIAKILGRNESTISRELNLPTKKNKNLSLFQVQIDCELFFRGFKAANTVVKLIERNIEKNF